MVDPLDAGVSAIRGVGNTVGSVADDVGEAVDRRAPDPEEIRDATVEVVEDAGIRAPDDANFIASQEEAAEQIRQSPQTTRRQAIENLQQQAGGEDADPAAVDATAGLQDELDQRARQLNEAVEQPARAGPVPNVAEGAVESLNPFAAASGVVEASERATTAALGQDREAQAQIGAEVLQAPEAAEQAVESVQQNPAEAAGRAAGLTVAALGGGVAASRGARIASNIDADIPGVAKSAATEVADRAGPVVSRELEAAGIDTSNFQPLTTQRQQVGAVFGQPEGGVQIRELRRAGIDADPDQTVDPDIVVEAGERGPFGRVLEPQTQRTLGGDEFEADRTRGFVEETRTFAAEQQSLSERADVGRRAQVDTVDFGDGEQVVVEGARGQTGLPEVTLETVEPGVARRLLGERSRIEVRGEPSNQATQAAVDEVLGDVEQRFGEILRQGERGRTVDEIELGEVPASETTPVIEEGRISADVEQFTSEIEGEGSVSEILAEEARRRAEESAEELPFDVDQVLFRSEIRRPRREIETFEQTPERDALFTSPEFTELGFFSQRVEGVGDTFPSGLTGALRGDINLPERFSRRRKQVLAIEPESIKALEAGGDVDLAEALQEADPGTAFTTERGFQREIEALLPPGTTLERVPGGEFRVETEQFGEVPGQFFRAVGEGETRTRAESISRGERAEFQQLGGEGRAVETEVETVTPEEAAREAIEQQDPAFIDPDDPAALSVGEEVADDVGTFDFSPNPFTGLGGSEETAEVEAEVPTDVDSGVLPTGETVESPLDETDVGQAEFLAPTDETDTAQDTQPRQDDRLLPAQDQDTTPPTVITPNPTPTDEGGTTRTPTPEFPLPDAEETEDEEEGGALGDLFTENPVASASEVLDDDGGIL
jgi:hypothetical protein